MADKYTRRINLYINGKEIKNELASIKGEMSKMITEQARMTIGSEDYIKKGKEIKVLKGIIQEHNESLKATGSMWDRLGKMGDKFNQYFTMFATFAAGFVGVILSGKKAISAFAELDDKISDVMKTTGLTKAEVYGLNSELKKLNTRTAQMELLDLGRVAGKLGITAKEDVLEFIKAADKINVALKEDLGGNTEEAINEIGKLVDIFKVKEKYGIEESMLKTGSAINSLGAASTANEGYIVEFTKRVAGIAPSADISLQNVMGLAATLDMLGQTSEVSSTVYSAVITGMFQDTATYANIAGMGVKQFSSLLKTNANEAFVKFLEGLNGNNAGMEQLVQKMDGLGLEGKRSIAVLGVLANNTQSLRDQQALSNKEFEKGTSITNEFNTKNENAQANLEKNRKKLQNLTVELGEKLLPVLTVSTSGMTYFVRIVGVLTDFFIKYGGTLVYTTVVIGAYATAVKLAALWTNRHTEGTLLNTIAIKAKTFATEAAFAATNLLAAAEMLLTGNIKGATQAMKVFFATTKLNPIGLIVAGITAAVGAFLYFRDGISQTARSASELYSSLIKQRQEITNLFDVVKKSAEGTKERADGIKKINETYGEYLPYLLTEKSTLNEIKTAQIAANIALRESIALKSKEKKMTEIMEESAKSQMESIEDLISFVEKKKGAGTAGLFQSVFSDEMEKYNSKSEKDRITAVAALSEKFGVNYLVIKEYADKIADAKNEEKSSLEKLDTFYKTFLGNRKKDLSVEEQITALRTDLSRAETKEEKKNIQEQIDLLEKRNKAKSGKKDNDTDAFTPITTEKKKYSLNDDMQYVIEKRKLNIDFAKGEIKSKEELDRKLLNLEIEYLDKAIKSGKYAGEQLANMQSELDDKKLKQTEDKLKAREYMLDAAGSTELEKENRRYQDDLANFNKYVADKEKLTKLEKAALQGIKKRHQDALDKIDADATRKEIENRQKTFEAVMSDFRLNQANELNAITNLHDAKMKLSLWMSKDELSKIKTLEDAKKEINKRFKEEEKEKLRLHLTELLNQLYRLQAGAEWKGLNLSDKLLSDEEKKVLLDRITELKAELAKLKDTSPDAETEVKKLQNTDKVDLLGFTKSDWEILFSNLRSGKIGIEEIAMATEAMGNLWQNYNRFVSAGEQRQLKEFEASTNKKKKKFKEQLDSGIISQEAYNKAIENLDAETERKRAEFDRDAAIRDRNVALMSAIVNTAVGVTKALPNLLLAALVGAAGAFQIGTILATPLPDLPGAEQGGYLDITRSQDNKKFRAKNEANKRGYVSSPTIITGENGMEYIVPDEATSNPSIRPVLDILEMARQNKNLATLNFPKVYEATVSGRMRGMESGGSLSGRFESAQRPGASAASTASTASTSHSDRSMDNELKQIILNNTRIMEILQKKLDDPIQTYVTVHGKNGLAEKLKEYDNLKNNASL